MRKLIVAVPLIFLFTLAAADSFGQWFPKYQAAVARSDAKAVSEGAQFPMNWENGPIRQITSQAEFEKRFGTYFTPEIKKMIATKKPEKSGDGEYTITWKARGNEYSIYFRPAGSGYVLAGLSEGPP